MKPSARLLALFGLTVASSALAQYGYTPPVAPTPPQPPTMPAAPAYPSYPSYPSTAPATPPAGMGVDTGYGYGTPSYGSPTYGSPTSGYAPQPMPGPAVAGFGATGDMLSYGYLEGFYQYTDFKDDLLEGASGVGLSLSAELFKPLFIKGGFNWGTAGGGTDEKDGYDFNSVSIGVGAYVPITQRFHLLFDVGGAYYKLDADKESVAFSDGAIYVHPAIRIAATESLELGAGLTFSSSDDYGTMLFDVGAYWKMFSALDLKLGADFGEEHSAYKAGLRLRW